MKDRGLIKSHKNAIMTVMGSVMLVSGVVLLVFWPDIFETIKFKQLELKPGSKSFRFWNEPPQPLYLDIYLFNWTNPEEFLNLSTKPRFDEIGPYRFQEFPQKVNITWNDNNSTVSYRKQSRYVFVPEGSKGHMTDVITSINVIALSAATRAKTWNILKAKSVSFGFSLYDQKVSVTKLASEWLFEGYEDSMLTIAKDMPMLDAGDIPFDKFGWFYSRNESSKLLGDFNANTGAGDITKIGKLRKWNYQEKNQFFENKCSEFDASAGDFFAPNMKKEDVVSLFSPEMCRSVQMDYEEEQTIQGIKTYKYSGGDRTVDNGTLFPENKCYCSGECVPSGLFNVSSCRYGTPVFMSFPHFYHADPVYLEQIEGMKPQKEKHQFFMSFEPNNAIPLEVAARFQLNILVSPIPNIQIYKNVPRKFMPILWFEQHVKLSEDIADEIKTLLRIPVAGQLIGIFTAFVGIFVLTFLPLKQILTNQCCDNRNIIKNLNLQTKKQESCDEKVTNLPEISPLIFNNKPTNSTESYQ